MFTTINNSTGAYKLLNLRTKLNLKDFNLLDKENISVQKLYNTANQNNGVINS